MAEAFQNKLRLVSTEEDVSVKFDTMSPEEAKALALAIQGNARLKTLDLQGSALGPFRGGGLPQVEVLAAGLKGSSVTTLGLRGTGLGDEGVQAVAAVFGESSILSLDLGANDIGVAGAQAVAESLKSSKVTTLNFSDNRSVGDEGAGALAAALKETSLRSLNLIFDVVRVQGARALAEGMKSSSLTTLLLFGNLVGDEGVKFLSAAFWQSSLQKVDLGRNDVGVEGARALAAGLKDSSLTCLQLSRNDIRSEGAEALLEGLRDSSVMEIDLEQCHMAEETRTQIQAIVEVNKARSFLLQMQVEKLESGIRLRFRTLGGSVAAVLQWSMGSPVQDLPKAVLMSLRSSGFQLPFKGLSALHLRLVLPHGGILDAGEAAASLAQQLAPSTEPSQRPPPVTSEGPREGADSSLAF